MDTASDLLTKRRRNLFRFVFRFVIRETFVSRLTKSARWLFFRRFFGRGWTYVGHRTSYRTMARRRPSFGAAAFALFLTLAGWLGQAHASKSHALKHEVNLS